MSTKTYVYPVVKQILRKFGFKNPKARKELMDAISKIYIQCDTPDENELVEIVGKIRRATLIEEGLENE